MEKYSSNEYIYVKNSRIILSSFEDSYFLYNEQNDRMLKVQSNPREYLLSYKSGNSSIDKLISSKKKWVKFPDIRLIQFSIPAKKLSKLFALTEKLLSINLVILSIILQIFLFIPFVNNNIESIIQLKSTPQSTLNHSFFIFISVLIVGIVHELGHYAIYQNDFHQDHIYWGMSLRYFVMTVFFSSVPFMFELPLSRKRKLITAGVRMQAQLGCIAMILGSIPLLHNYFFVILWFSNLTILLINILPFMKLDGFWMINSFLGVHSYTESFWNDIKNKKVPNGKTSLLTFLNYISILIVIAPLVRIVCNFFGDM